MMMVRCATPGLTSPSKFDQIAPFILFYPSSPRFTSPATAPPPPISSPSNPTAPPFLSPPRRRSSPSRTIVHSPARRRSFPSLAGVGASPLISKNSLSSAGRVFEQARGEDSRGRASRGLGSRSREVLHCFMSTELNGSATESNGVLGPGTATRRSKMHSS
ncbi:hypothetical protein Droror1_Dr00021701 [Drosera rotundifolia]